MDCKGIRKNSQITGSFLLSENLPGTFLNLKQDFPQLFDSKPNPMVKLVDSPSKTEKKANLGATFYKVNSRQNQNAAEKNSKTVTVQNA